jgi:hypothetical protein
VVACIFRPRRCVSGSQGRHTGLLEGGVSDKMLRTLAGGLQSPVESLGSDR